MASGVWVRPLWILHTVLSELSYVSMRDNNVVRESNDFGTVGHLVGGRVLVSELEVIIQCGLLTLIREWDVAAGICLLQEAGGLVTTANPPDDLDGPIEGAPLGGRLYLAVRPAGDSLTENGREGQERTVREVWKRTRRLEYSRPGV